MTYWLYSITTCSSFTCGSQQLDSLNDMKRLSKWFCYCIRCVSRYLLCYSNIMMTYTDPRSKNCWHHRRRDSRRFKNVLSSFIYYNRVNVWGCDSRCSGWLLFFCATKGAIWSARITWSSTKKVHFSWRGSNKVSVLFWSTSYQSDNLI